MSLSQYVRDHIEVVSSDESVSDESVSDAAELVFFRVSLKNNADAEVFKNLIENHQGEFCECNLFDGNEHNYIEIGGWIGDQGLALQMMGLGKLLGLWNLYTPCNMLKLSSEDEMAVRLAEQGMITIKA